MEMRSLHILTCARGSTSFWKKKAPMLIPPTRTMRGIMTRTRLIPEAFMAVSSNFSPKLPKVMSDASSIASGSDMGTMLTAA